MRPIHLCVLFLALALAGCGSHSAMQNTTPTQTTNPTTTTNPTAPTTNPPSPNPTSQGVALNALTGNNSSAADSFPTLTDGNLGANNVSKLNIHSLLYPGATTKILAQFLLWFGQSNHMSVGYKSSDPGQVQRQITDMISRGIDGVIVDWYGPNNVIDQATQMVMHEAEKHAGFSFAIMIDAGAIANACSNCSEQEALTSLLQYVEKNYFPSPAYLTLQGQPVVTNFNIDRQNSLDWQKANSALQTPPRFLFQDSDGFKHSMSDGSYSWVMPQSSNYGFDYLTSFYQTGMGFANLETMGAVYKGFNDALASWGSGRYMNQQCGQTWLQTFSKINSMYNQGRQLPYLQLVTWNDYEEGTEMESGIDNCFSLEASINGSTLEWSTNGNENTIDHYSVYTGNNGNLSKLSDLQPGTHSVDLCSLSPPSGSQQIYVQAVGKPSIANRMPAPVSYTPACGH